VIRHGLYEPPNQGVSMRQDRRWPMAFGLMALLAMILWASFALVGWPRLESMSLRYRILRLQEDVKHLEEEEARLEAEINHWKSPAALAGKAREMGLHPPFENTGKGTE